MSSPLLDRRIDFTLDAAHEAHEPPEARGARRDGVRLMVSRGEEDPIDTGFSSLASFLTAGDVLVVNASATINAAFRATLPDRTPVMLHYSGELPGGLSLVEVRAVVLWRGEHGSSDRLEVSTILPGGAR